MGNVLRQRAVVASAQRVNVGTKVRLYEYATGEEWEVTLVGPDEADLDRVHLSIDCPLGAALLDRQVNETIDVDAPAGRISYRLVAIQSVE